MEDQEVAGRRREAFVLDAFGYALLLGLFYFVFLALPAASMGSYNDIQRNLFLRWTPFAYGFFFLQHLFFHWWRGGSFGQMVFSLRYADATEPEKVAPFRVHLRRAALATLVFPTLILLPGPTIGFIGGPETGGVSLIALGLGVTTTIWLCRPDRNGQNWLERIAGIRLVKVQ